MARRNYTPELIKSIQSGRKAVCSVDPYEGWEVSYRPRNRRDPEPWILENGFRYSGRFCHTVPLVVGDKVWISNGFNRSRLVTVTRVHPDTVDPAGVSTPGTIYYRDTCSDCYELDYSGYPTTEHRLGADGSILAV